MDNTYNYEKADSFKNEIESFIIDNDLMDKPSLSNFMNLLNIHGFFELPASVKYHHNVKGGLYHHSYEVMELLKYFGLNEVFAFKVGLFHDICKIFEHDIDKNGEYINVIHNDIHEHGKLSVSILKKYFKNLTDEEIACIEYHMGVYSEDKSYWSEYNEVCGMYPNLILTHAADMISAQCK